MAYIPQHKRHSRDLEKRSPTAELLAQHFTKKSYSWPYGRNGYIRGNILYADEAIYNWFSIGSPETEPFSCVHLVPFSVPLIERRGIRQPLALVNNFNIPQGN